MLVKFTVENFRVFRDEQSFSMIASPSSIKTEPEQLIDTGFTPLPYLYQQSVIYGANGAGKSSLFDALRHMTRFVRDSHNLPSNANIETYPFLYDAISRQQPTKFKITFFLDNTLFAYSFTFNYKRVIEEYLLARPNPPGRTRRLFTRQFDHEKEKYNWFINPKFFKGNINGIRSFTRSNALFLGTAVNLNNDSLKKIYNQIVSKPVFISESDQYLKDYTSRLFYDRQWKQRIVNFFKIMDAKIVDISVKSSASKVETENNLSVQNYEENCSDRINGNIEFDITFIRLDNNGRRVPLPLNRESLGTQLLFQIAGRFAEINRKGANNYDR